MGRVTNLVQMNLYDDQIHAPSFIKECDYIWSDDVSRSVKSGVYPYYEEISKEFGKPLVDESNIPKSGVIFIGMCHIIEDVFKRLPKDGNYIIVHRTNDRSFTEAMWNVRPPSVKHTYTVDCQVVKGDVTAIPFGNASINGEDLLVKQIAKEKVKRSDKRIFLCYNTNPGTPHRNESIEKLKGKDFVTCFVPSWPDNQMASDEFARNVKAHEFTMALAGMGMDASRQWMAIQLGSIPIVTDCVEMRHFQDLPIAYCPPFEQITHEWLDYQRDINSKKSTQRAGMSYWINDIKETRKRYGIN